MSDTLPLTADPTSARTTLNLRVLTSVRRVLRRVELSSRELEGEYGVTTPQLICLGAIAAAGSITQAELAEQVHLTASTLVGVLDRLEAKQLAVRTRDVADRRRINLTVTAKGAELARRAPTPLQDTLLKGLEALSDLELLAMTASLERLVDLLEAHGAATSPILAPGPIPKPEV